MASVAALPGNHKKEDLQGVVELDVSRNVS